MPKITSVEPQKGPKRFNIFLDGNFAFGADEDLVVDKRLIPGKEISLDDLQQLVKDAEIGKLMERMYRLFNVRQRSEKEVRDYLKNLSFRRKLKGEEKLGEFIIDTIVQLMKRKGMLDDKQFATSWMQSRSRKYGPQRIKQELYKKGIDREIIEEVVSGQRAHTESGEDYSAVAEKLLEKRIDRWKELPQIKQKKKAYEFLLRRGFDYEEVKNTVENILRKR